MLLTTPTSTSHVSSPLASQPHKGLLLKRITGAKPGCSQRSMRQRKVRLHTTQRQTPSNSSRSHAGFYFHRLVFPKITEIHSADESFLLFSVTVLVSCRSFCVVSGGHAVLDFIMMGKFTIHFLSQWLPFTQWRIGVWDLGATAQGSRPA